MFKRLITSKYKIKIVASSNEILEAISDGGWQYLDDEDDSYALEEYFNKFGNTGYFFDNPSRLPTNSWLIHFTSKDPVVIKNSGFKGLDQRWLGLTKDSSTKQGHYALAYALKDLSEKDIKANLYGSHALVFKATEAVRAYHNTDNEYQVIFDVRSVNYSKSIPCNSIASVLELLPKLKPNETVGSSADVWYHGRSVDSEKFDLSYVGRDEAKDQEGPGFYFTTDKKDAAGYAHPSGVILTVKLTPRKLVSNTEPAPMKDVTYLIDKAPDKENTLMNWDENPVKALRMATKSMIADTAKQTFESIWFDFYRNDPKQYLENLVHLGYDGHYAERTSKHIIIYNPKAIHVIKKEQY